MRPELRAPLTPSMAIPSGVKNVRDCSGTLIGSNIIFCNKSHAVARLGWKAGREIIGDWEGGGGTDRRRR